MADNVHRMRTIRRRQATIDTFNWALQIYYWPGASDRTARPKSQFTVRIWAYANKGQGRSQRENNLQAAVKGYLRFLDFSVLQILCLLCTKDYFKNLCSKIQLCYYNTNFLQLMTSMSIFNSSSRCYLVPSAQVAAPACLKLVRFISDGQRADSYYNMQGKRLPYLLPCIRTIQTYRL